MCASPDHWLLYIKRYQEEERAGVEREALARTLRLAQRQQRVARLYCAVARWMITQGTTILSKFDDDENSAALRQRRV